MPTDAVRSRWSLPVSPAVLTTVGTTLLGVAGPFAVAAALVPWRDELDSANVALALVVVVVAVAATARRLAAAVAAVSAMLAFDLWFTVPYGSLSVRSGNDVETLVLLLAVGLGVGQVAVVGRRHWTLATRREADLRRVERVTRELTEASSVFAAVALVEQEMVTLLNLRSCRAESSRTATNRPRVEPEGRLRFGQLWWGTDSMGLPGPEVEVPAGPLRLVLEPTPGVSVPADHLLVAVILGRLLGVVLEGRTTFGPEHLPTDGGEAEVRPMERRDGSAMRP